MSNKGFKVDKHIQLRPQGGNPVDTAAGDLWFDGSDLKFNDGSSTKSIIKGSRSVELTNNQATPANITGFSASSSTETGFSAEYTITRSRIASFDLDTTFNPTANGRNYRIVGQPDGKVLLCGDFTTYNGDSTRKYFIRLNSDGTEDTAFNANIAANSGGGGFQFLVSDAIVQSDNKIIVSGQFTQYGTDAAKDWILRFNSDGTEDTVFNTNISSVPGLIDAVWSIALQSDNKIVCAGWAGGARTLRLNSDGTEDSSYATNANASGGFNNILFAVALQSDGKILLGGSFTSYKGDTNKKYFIRLNSDGTEDTAFSDNFHVSGSLNADVQYITVQADGKILLGGDFTSYKGDTNKKYLIRVNSDGTEDTTFNSTIGASGGFNSSIYAIKQQTDGKLLVGGWFSSYKTDTSKKYMLRFNSDGTEDTAFNTAIGAGGGFGYRVFSIAFGANNTILVGGQFSSYAGNFSRGFAIRFNNDLASELVKQGSIRGRYLPLTNTWSIGGGSYIGDDVGVVLSITSSGQVQYTSTNITLGTTNVDKIDFTIIKT